MLLIATVIDRHNLSDGLSRPRNPEWLQLRPNAVIDLEIRPDDEVITGLCPQEFSDSREPMPVLAGLVRAGVVFTGSVQRGTGLFSSPNPRTYSITGVNEFGRRLLADLEGLAEHQETFDAE